MKNPKVAILKLPVQAVYKKKKKKKKNEKEN